MGFRKFFVAAVLALSTVGGAAAASTVVVGDNPMFGDFERFRVDGANSGGTYGLELRGGNAARLDQTWQTALGSSTSTPSLMDERSGFDWNAATNWLFELTIDATGSNFWLWAEGDRPETARATFGPLETGNAIRVATRHLATITIGAINGETLGLSLGNIAGASFQELVLFNEDFANGFTMTGTVDLARGGNASNFVQVTTGNVNVIPLPAAGWLLLSGLAGLGVVARRKRAAA